MQKKENSTADRNSLILYEASLNHRISTTSTETPASREKWRKEMKRAHIHN